jgi:HSP20 family molecular chaperone IbpA
MRTHEKRRTAAVDVFSGKDGWTVVADVPGCAKEDVELSIADGKLTIEARAQRPDIPATAVKHRSEAAGLPFGRTLALPPDLDPSRATARIDRGVLTVSVPKRDRPAEERRVPIA